mgnify:CR=1 FL=1
MKKLTILVGLVTSTMLITASNTGTSSSSETEATRKEIIKEMKAQTTYPEGFFKEVQTLGIPSNSATIEQEKSQPKDEKQAASWTEAEYFQNGVASFYGEKWNGRRTANGEIFNTYELTAAHKTLPFGTKVRVTNEANGKSVVVRINDRGPFVKGRIIDMSTAAFASIGSTDSGIAKVKLEIKKNEEKNRILIQQSRMASMGEMLENIAHQWRQPLSTISVAASGMEVKKEFSTLSDEEFFEGINHIKKSTVYLSNTIDDFRTFFIKEKKTSQMNIKNAIEKALELMGNTFMQQRINLVKNIEEIEILSLENELIQVLMNIFVNAKDALKQTLGDEKYIIIDVFKKEDNLIIQIKDSAKGIDEKIIDKIFEPYFTTKHKFKGTGIGLYMSKLLVEKHLKGSIKTSNTEFTFMDKIHKGALFEIILPIS